MSISTELILVVIILAVVILLLGVMQRRPRRLNKEYFGKKWQVLQKQCASKSTWALAVIDADKLLDEALKKRRFKGKTMGGRLMTAQHSLTDNDGAWFAHKLRNQLVHESDAKLTERKVKDALVGIRQALKDLKAL
ncbi:MAG TPA: hypothetical protein VMR28_03450 [Candidatus Saccharimonadales bacterium]|nr:hypothetical protein [Candidatus Saccharimonadales bacterium]